jgi:8-oxo-dGTP pyrophosphatase MutT (NUDIX family)
VRREFSAGGVLVRRLEGRWVTAAIRPAGKKPGTWALPKGRIDEGESGEETALREVAEETGAYGRSLGKLGDVRYWFNWEGERIFKVVSFFLVRYESGRLGDLPPAHRHEVA